MSTAAVLVPVLAAATAAAAAAGLRSGPPAPRRARSGLHPAPPRRGAGLLERAGGRSARLLRLPDDPGSARRLGLGALVALLLAPVSPAAAPAVMAGAVTRTVLVQRRAGAEERRAVRTTLPDAVDLLLLSATAGMGLAIGHTEVARRLPGPVGAALRRADDQAQRGRPRADALIATLAPHGERAGALAHLLADHLRYGTPLVPELERLGMELRIDRRRAAEEEARKVPVRLLAPLITCTLPAFALLTVAPLLLASLRHLPT